MRYYYGILFLALGCCLAACDAQPGQEPCREPLQVLQPIADIGLITGSEGETLDLEGEPRYFNAGAEQNVRYSVASVDEEVVRVQVIGERGRLLRLIPGQVGATELRVRAVDDCGGDVEQAFTVAVAQNCTGEGEVRLVHVDSGFSLYAGEDIELALGGPSLAFEHSIGQALEYAITRVEPGLSAQITGGGTRQYVHLQGESVGDASVTVRATDACGNQAEAQVVVRVLDPCPPSPGTGMADYLPLTLGDEWVFDYTSQFGNAFGPSGNAVGTLTWTIESVGACSRGRQRYQIHSTLVDTTYYEGDSYPPRSSTRTDLITIEALGDSVLLPFLPEPVLRYGPASGPDTLSFSKGIILSVYHGYSVTLKLVRDRGIVRRSRDDWDKLSSATQQFTRREGN